MFNDEEDDENSIGAVRYPCMPSLVSLQQMRNRLHLAYLGRKLMKWTALATGRELRRLSAEIDAAYRSFGEDMRNAFILLARGRYFYPNLNKMVLENVTNVASVRVASNFKTISGVKVLEYTIIESGTEPYEHLGIEKGGQKIHEAKIAWLELLKRMVLMLELRTSFDLVDKAHKNATKKKYVLAKTVVPRILTSVGYLLSELEKQEREETSVKKDTEKKIPYDQSQKRVEIVCNCCLSMYEIKNEKDPETDSLCSLCAEGLKKTLSSEMDICCELQRDVVETSENEEKKRLEHITTHIDEVIFDLVNQPEGLVTPSTERFIETCSNFKGNIGSFASTPLELSLCDLCKQNEIIGTRMAKKPSHSGSTKSVTFPPEEIKPSRKKEELRYYETKTEEIVKIIKFQNKDGTVGEEKQVIKIKTERKAPSVSDNKAIKTENYAKIAYKTTADICNSDVSNKASKTSLSPEQLKRLSFVENKGTCCVDEVGSEKSVKGPKKQIAWKNAVTSTTDLITALSQVQSRKPSPSPSRLSCGVKVLSSGLDKEDLSNCTIKVIAKACPPVIICSRQESSKNPKKSKSSDCITCNYSPKSASGAGSKGNVCKLCSNDSAKKPVSESSCPTCDSGQKKPRSCPKCGKEKKQPPKTHSCPICNVTKSQTTISSKSSCGTCEESTVKPSDCPTCDQPVKPACPKCDSGKERPRYCPKCGKEKQPPPKPPSCPICNVTKSQTTISSKSSCAISEDNKVEPSVCPTCDQPVKSSCSKCGTPCPSCNAQSDKLPAASSKPSLCKICSVKSVPTIACPSCAASQNVSISPPTNEAKSCPFCEIKPGEPVSDENDKKGKKKKDSKEIKHSCKYCGQNKNKKGKDKEPCPICKSVESRKSLTSSASQCGNCPTCGQTKSIQNGNKNEPDKEASCPLCGKKKKIEETVSDDKSKKNSKDKKDKHACKYCGESKSKKKGKEKQACPICSAAEAKKALDCNYCDEKSGPAATPSEGSCSVCGKPKEPKQGSKISCPDCDKPKELEKCKTCQEKENAAAQANACPTCSSQKVTNSTSKSSISCKVCEEKVNKLSNTEQAGKVCPACGNQSKPASDKETESPCPSCNKKAGKKKSKSQCNICEGNAKELEPKCVCPVCGKPNPISETTSQSNCPSCGANNSAKTDDKNVDSPCPSCKKGANTKKQCNLCLQNVEEDKKHSEFKCPCAEPKSSCPTCDISKTTDSEEVGVCPSCGSKKSVPSQNSLCTYCQNESDANKPKSKPQAKTSSLCKHCQDEESKKKESKCSCRDSKTHYTSSSTSLCEHCKEESENESKSKCSCRGKKSSSALEEETESKCSCNTKKPGPGDARSKKNKEKSKCTCNAGKKSKPLLKKSSSSCPMCDKKKQKTKKGKEKSCPICKKKLAQERKPGCPVCSGKKESRSSQSLCCAAMPSAKSRVDFNLAVESNDSCSSLSNKSFGIETEACVESCSSYKSFTSDEDIDDEEMCCSTQTQNSPSKSCCAIRQPYEDRTSCGAEVNRRPKCGYCNIQKRDAAANTKLADRFDVRPVHMIPGASSKPNCCCKVEPSSVCNCKSEPNCTPSKKPVRPFSSKSFNGKDFAYYGQFYI